MKILNNSLNASSKSKLFNFTQGLEYDKPMYKEEIKIQKEWVIALAKIGLLEESEKQNLVQSYHLAEEEIKQGTFEWAIEDEDIHMNLERFITQKSGDLGKKVHLGRSRNDLVATTLRLFWANKLEQNKKILNSIISSLLNFSKKNIEIIIPGMTHMQNGQPIRISSVFLSYAESLIDCKDEIDNTIESCLNYCPLGSAAFAGTTLPVDLSEMAKNLGFQKPLSNSVHAVGDRKFLLSVLNSLSLIAINTEKICNDLIYWSSSNVGLLKLPKDWSTGSSIMPNKRNPDILELIRAKSSKILSCEQSGKMLYKSVGSSYHTDYHELKKITFDSYSELEEATSIFHCFLGDLEINKDVSTSLLNKGHILATDIANDLVDQGINFRDAYTKIADLVSEADSKNIQIHELVESKEDDPFLSSVEKRDNQGGTSKVVLEKRINQIREDVLF